MIEASYRELLKIDEVFEKGFLIDNYQLFILVNPEDCDNEVWLEFIDFVKSNNLGKVYKAHSCLEEGKFDDFRLDTYSTGLLDKQKIEEMVSFLEKLEIAIPDFNNKVTFIWISSIQDLGARY